MNINEIISQFAPDAHAEVHGNKVEWYNEKTKISVVADIGGGYLRLQDKSVPYNLYLDIHGKDVRNYIDANGKQHGRPKAEREALTHFRMALLAIMVVDIQREYRFYSEKEEIRLQKNMDVRRKYVGIARRVRSTQNRPAAASDLRG